MYLERLKLVVKFCAHVGYVMYAKTHWNFPGCRTCSVGFPEEWQCIIPSQGNLSEIKRNGNVIAFVHVGCFLLYLGCFYPLCSAARVS